MAIYVGTTQATNFYLGSTAITGYVGSLSVTGVVVAPVLNTLSLSGASFTAGAAAGTVIGSITGKTAGSTITVSDNRLAISSDGLQLLVGVTASSAGTINATLTETLAGATGSPKTTAVAVTVAAATISPTYLPTVSVAPSMVLATSKLIAGYSGPAARVQRVSDDAEQDVGFGSKFLDMSSAAAFRGSSELGVKTLYDQSGNGFHEVQATKAQQPGLFAKLYGETPVVSFDSQTTPSTVSKRMSNPSLPLTANAFTVFALMVPNVSLKGSVIYTAPSDANTTALYTRMNSAQSGNVGLVVNNTSVKNSAVIPPMQPCVLAHQGGASSVIRLNGVKTVLTGTAPASTALLGLTLGRFDGFTSADFDALYDLIAFVVYPSALNDADCAAVEASLLQQIAVSTTQSVKLIFDGDSRTEGFGATKNEFWARKLVRQLSVPVYAANMGVGGQTLNTMGTRAGVRVAVQYDASKAKNIVVMGGPAINDFSASRTAAQAQADFIAYANGIHANQLLIAATVPLHNGHTTAQNTERVAYNSWLRANWQTYSEGFVDLDQVPGLSAYSTTYFIDAVHFNDAGHDLFVSAFKPEVERLIAA